MIRRRRIEMAPRHACRTCFLLLHLLPISILFLAQRPSMNVRSTFSLPPADECSRESCLCDLQVSPCACAHVFTFIYFSVFRLLIILDFVFVFLLSNSIFSPKIFFFFLLFPVVDNTYRRHPRFSFLCHVCR